MAEHLRIGGVPEHFNLPWKLAVADRAFDSIGVEVAFIEHPGGTGAMTAALRAADLDAALLLTLQVGDLRLADTAPART